MSSISYEAAIGAAIVAFNDLWAVHSLPSIWPTPNFLKALLQWPLLRFDPNDFDASPVLANLKVMEGRGAEAVACMERALRLNPHPPGPYYWDLGQAHYAAGDYKAAVKALRNEATYRTDSQRILAAALAQLGQLDEAREEAKLYLVRNPHFRISYWVETQPFRDLATRDR